VTFNCWMSNPQVNQWMTEHGYNSSNLTQYKAIEQLYETNLLNLIAGLGKDYICWQEIFDNGLTVKPNTVIDVWKSPWQSELFNVTAKNLTAILAAPWYLNIITYGADWSSYYTVEPLSFNGTEHQDSLVIGGEACMWGEYVDSTNLISRMWPRACAVAERLWSPRDVTNLTNAELRLQSHTCRLLRRSIDAEPANGPSFCNEEWYAQYQPPWAQQGGYYNNKGSFSRH